ncbi:MAG: hypothetical protein QM767_19835 [Anaeromyxobacter sp.]
MPKRLPETSQVKAIMAAVRSRAALRDDPAIPAPGEVASRAAQRSAGQLLAAHLAQSGYDLTPVEKLREQHQARARRDAERFRVEALEGAGPATSAARAAAVDRAHQLEQAPGVAESHLLQAPFEVVATRDLRLSGRHDAPLDTWVKFRETSSGSGAGDVVFSYLWQNLDDRFRVVQVDGFLVLNGVVQMGADGGWGGEASSQVNLTARLQLWEWWNQPPTVPMPEPNQSLPAFSRRLETPWAIMDVGAVSSDAVFRGFDLRYETFLVPPQGVAVLDVVLGVSYANADGNVDLDFESGDLRVASPAVIVRVLP